MNSVSRGLSWIAGAFLILLLVFALPSFFNPEFMIENQSVGTCVVKALWRDQEKSLGMLEAGKSLNFSLDDESAMRFRVSTLPGKTITSEPIYFSRGLRIKALIT